MAAKPDIIDLLNQAVEREFQVAVQYFLQHDEIEKIIKKQIPENIFDKTTYDAVGILIQEMKMQLTSAKGLIGEVKK
jgi:bacterioferritin (cytochrome b1)